MIEWLPWLRSKSCYTNLKFFETLKDTPNPSKGFRFVAFLVLEILGGGGGSFSTPPWCLVWVPKPLVPGGLSHQFGTASLVVLLHTASAHKNEPTTFTDENLANDLGTKRQQPILPEVEFVNLPLVGFHSNFSTSAVRCGTSPPPPPCPPNIFERKINQGQVCVI